MNLKDLLKSSKKEEDVDQAVLRECAKITQKIRNIPALREAPTSRWLAIFDGNTSPYPIE